MKQSCATSLPKNSKVKQREIIQESVFNLTKYTFTALTNQQATPSRESANAFIVVKREKKCHTSHYHKAKQ